MPELHSTSFEEFDFEVTVQDDGSVNVYLKSVAPTRNLGMTWDELCELVHFAAIHGLGMKNPWIGEYAETVEGAAA
jgi:hypothetical protein